jgi:retron-type reverse transcriptase
MSDGRVVPKKPPNNDTKSAEAVEGRRPTKGNMMQASAPSTLSETGASCVLYRVRMAARKDKRARFTALLHHITIDHLRDSFYALKRNAAPGVDGVTWQQYEVDLETQLVDLHRRVHRGAYRAQPSKRAYIPKPDGRQRPLGIAALEDKVVQQAVVWVLNAIYEQDFLGFSYGFRIRRGAHDALDALWVGVMWKKVNWVLDADIQDFFGTVNHGWLLKFIGHRVADPRILRLIQKWLRAGVSEDGQWSKTDVGVPQGAVASPLLANVYLHYVFDLWVQQWRTRFATGDVVVVRYADVSSSASSIVARPSGSCGNCGNACSRSAWSCTRTKPGCSNSGGSPPRIGSSVARANRRLSTSWASPIFVGRRSGLGSFTCGGYLR